MVKNKELPIENAVRLNLVVFFGEMSDDEPHPMVAFTDDLDDLIGKHFPEYEKDATYDWEHI